ncbi:MAG: P-loop NTPase [Candidatus Desulfatibia sp.]|uniref:MinD/ParA family ATP-binding protein n=1 Tax=Candidatus Desulfatibia sp. TaxID=3101189 RepID=UPI002F31DCE3
MIPIDALKTGELQKVRIACSYIFSAQLARSDEFLKSLGFDLLKKTYRKKVKKYHPDFHSNEQPEMINRRSERFIKIRESYEILSSYLPKKPQTISERDNSKGKIVAIGGAKGGIGKSLLAANLGVLLSSKGFRTVVVDLDLGGANLHLYLGETFIKSNINDFLDKSVSTLQQTMISTKYGPLLIGGNSSQLGAANISFMRKLKLMKAVKNLDADFIIIDLGGDTSYNIIDFFLLADHGIVMTTCDPASYLEAYNFIKMALYRKLNRLFGPESKYKAQKDNDLEKLIVEATMSTNGSKVVKVDDLVKKVKRQFPRSLSVLKEAISTFRPYLVVNRIPPNFNESQIIKRIQKVTRQMLSIEVRYLESFFYHPEVELSARSLVPTVVKSASGDLAGRMSRVVECLVNN